MKLLGLLAPTPGEVESLLQKGVANAARGHGLEFRVFWGFIYSKGPCTYPINKGFITVWYRCSVDPIGLYRGYYRALEFHFNKSIDRLYLDPKSMQNNGPF